MSTLSTHVLDTATGRPAAGIAVVLEREAEQGAWIEVGVGVTNDDGRLSQPLAGDDAALDPGTYRLTFHTGAYFDAAGVGDHFYDSVPVQFSIRQRGEHFHVPLLLSPFGYSTYRGS